ncbi:ABC transporter ATP-binding protein [Methanococcus sp. CF]
MLKLENVSFDYGKTKILNDCRFSLNGGIGCILGPNGAGKSTILKCISGIVPVKSGNITIDGKNTTQMSCKDRSRLISYSPQEFSINFPYTVFEVVLMGRNPHVNFLTGPSKKDEQKVTEILNLLKISHLKDKEFISLSGGQKRHVMIATALIQDAKLMIFDEPTSFLDYKNQYLVLSVIEKISIEMNKTVLLSLHDPNLAFLFCDKLFLMKNGKILFEIADKNSICPENFQELYGINTKFADIFGQKVVLPDKEYLKTMI